MDLAKIDELLARVEKIAPMRNTSKKKEKIPIPTGRNRNSAISKKGYVYDWDKETEKLVLRHRVLMVKKLGRPLHPHESVFFKDKNRENFDLDNLGLGLKPGFGIEELTCPHCEMKYG